MNVYDFDNTILKGDSTVLFLFYLYRRKFMPIRFLKSAFYGLLYLLKLCPKQRMKEVFFEVLPLFDDIDAQINSFWDKNMKRVKIFYLNQKKDNDLVISASPFFLISEACKRLGISCMASPVNKLTGKYEGLNCHGEEKVRRFREKYSGEIEEFYSDSHSDDPLARIAQKAYLVKGDRIEKWN